MKKISVTVVAALLGITLYGCASAPLEREAQLSGAEQSCLGSSVLPEKLSVQFEAVADDQLLQQALGAPSKGKLCQGRVYRSKEEGQIIIYRVWNSTNPQSKFGRWWAFEAPKGDIAQYRADYEICYQWSPLDALVSCRLKAGTKVVVGTGQSGQCSEYLSYPVSARQQIYLENASASVIGCITLKGEFSWK